MKHAMPSGLLSDLWLDLHQPGLRLQISTLIGCILVGWALSHFLQKKFSANNIQTAAIRLGVESFTRVLSPLLILILLTIATIALSDLYRINLLRVAIPLAASFALTRAVFYAAHRLFAREGRSGAFLLLFEKIFPTIVGLGVALYLSGWWPDLLRYIQQTTLPIGRYQVSLFSISQAGLSVVFTLIIASSAGALLEERLKRMDSLHPSLRAVLVRAGKAGFILVAVLFSLSVLGIDLTILSVFGGALGVGLGLGLQKIVSSYISGFVILFERSLAVGDMVMIDKYYGQVMQINARYTVVRSGDGVETVVPNELLVSGLVQNYSLTDKLLRLVTQITINYRHDVEEVIQIIEEAALAVPRVNSQPPPQGLLLKFGQNGFELELAFWISDPENGRSNILSDVNRSLWLALKNRQILISPPQYEIKLATAHEMIENEASLSLRHHKQ